MPNARLRRALDHIEGHLFEPLSLSDVAGAAGLSPYHFSRLFSAVLGETVMVHVRRRRLEAVASRLLAEPAPRLIDLAFDCGFESQQAFTRAFTRTLGMSPGRFRRERPPIQGDFCMNATESDLKPDVRLVGEVKRGGFIVCGLVGRFDGTSIAGVPALWDRLVRTLPLPEQAAPGTYGVCWSAGEEGVINYMAGVEVAEGARPPAEFDVKVVPAQTYLAYRLTVTGAELHPQMQAAMRVIWGEMIPASGRTLAKAPDLEVYPADFDPTRPGATVEYWIPVEG